MLGQTVSHYKIIEKLGEGGMGVVYKAEDLRLGRSVALKFLPPHVGINEESKSRFMLEARAASMIDHANIGTIHEIDEAPDGSMFIVMSCYDGESLKEKIGKGRLSVNEAVDLALQIAQGMAKAHERSIIHRDLKPGNVLITGDGHAKIIDFGLAKLIGGAHLTRSGTTLGTVAYMSPEQAAGDDVDPRSDIWSLGVILYEMLTGNTPFRGEFETALLYSITNEQPQPIETYRDDIPIELRVIIDRALQKVRDKRYQCMDEVVADLKSIQLKERTGQGVPQTPESDWRSASRSIRYILWKHKAVTVFLPAAVIILVLALLVLKTLITTTEPTTLSRSVAILPFSNIGESEQAYLADGLAKEISSGLSRYPQILVISQRSAEELKNAAQSDSAIAARLGVRYLLKGELLLATARIKIKLSFYDTHEDAEIWKDHLDISRSEVFAIKQDIVREIIDRLGIDQGAIQSRAYITSPDVYDLYLQGIYHRDRQNREDNLLAITFLSEAVRKDTNYLLAIVSLANAQVEQYRQGWDPTEKQLNDARSNCEKALLLDSTSSQALAQLGILHDLAGDPQRGLTLLMKSLEIEKNNAVALTSIAHLYLFKFGEAAKGVMYLKQLQQIDPLDWLTTMNLGVAYGQMKNYPEAINAFRRAIQLNPSHEWPPYCMAYTFERIAEFDSAAFHYRASLGKNPMNPKTYEGLVSLLLADGRYSAAESVLADGIRYLQDDPQMHYGLGVTCLFLKRQTRAMRSFRVGLNIVKGRMRTNPGVGDNVALAGLFHARLGDPRSALQEIEKAVLLDSTNEEVLMKASRACAVLGRKREMLEYFARARAMNPEYDVSYLRVALDYEQYRDDPELLSAAREQPP